MQKQYGPSFFMHQPRVAIKVKQYRASSLKTNLLQDKPQQLENTQIKLNLSKLNNKN